MNLDPSLFTVFTWPRYGRQNQYVALGFVCIVFCALMGAKSVRTNPLLGSCLLALTAVAHVFIGAVLFSIEMYAESMTRKAED